VSILGGAFGVNLGLADVRQGLDEARRDKPAAHFVHNGTWRNRARRGRAHALDGAVLHDDRRVRHLRSCSAPEQHGRYNTQTDKRDARPSDPTARVGTVTRETRAATHAVLGSDGTQ